MQNAREKARESIKQYRKQKMRIDYYPQSDVADILRHHQKHGLEDCLAGVIDTLIRAGHSAVSRKTQQD